jgi:MFS family permease
MKTSNNKIDSVQGIKNILRALRNKNYRLFFIGQGLSLIGTWMQNIAMSWLVYRLTNSPFYLGVVGFSSQIPILLAAPLGGVLADRWNKKNILIFTQALSLLQAAILAILVITGAIQIWHVILMSILLGTVNGFDMPTRQAFVYELVENRDDLPNAIALNSLIFNGARLIGPTIAGLIIAAAGEGACFLINAVSFIPVLAVFAFMKIRPSKIPLTNGHVFADIHDGFKYAAGFVPIRAILLLLIFIGLAAMPYSVLMPVFARDILLGNSRTLGFLMGATGVGAITGALFLAAQKTVSRLSSFVVMALSIFAVAIFAFSMSGMLWFSMIMLTLAGFGLMVMIAAVNTVLQTIVDDDKRGRVMSLYSMSFIGMAPFGSLLAGTAAHIIGAPRTVLISGCLCILAAVLFSRKLPEIKKLIHPIYVRKGILPEVADGLGTASRLTEQTKE